MAGAGLLWRKPFGHDLSSAADLQRRIGRYLEEGQIYRIDHYLGKATVQNVLVFRFANLMMKPVWNRHHIDHVQITHSETLGVGSRTGFYDGTGALRDMIQSHLLQLLTLVAMEPPVSMEAEALRDEKVKVLKSVRPITKTAVHAQAFRAQYAAGEIDGKSVPGYVQEDRVDPRSVTETYAALKLYIDNWRWRGVPFYLRTGEHGGGALHGVDLLSSPADAALSRHPGRVYESQLDPARNSTGGMPAGGTHRQAAGFGDAYPPDQPGRPLPWR